MMNILDTQDNLKNFSQEQLLQEMQNPSGNAPQFLVLSELTRRKRVRDSHALQQSKQGETTVAQDAIAASGAPQAGIMGMAKAMAPNSAVGQNTGIGQLPPKQQGGGPKAGYAEGGEVEGGFLEKLRRLFDLNVGREGSIGPQRPLSWENFQASGLSWEEYTKKYGAPKEPLVDPHFRTLMSDLGPAEPYVPEQLKPALKPPLEGAGDAPYIPNASGETLTQLLQSMGAGSPTDHQYTPSGDVLGTLALSTFDEPQTPAQMEAAFLKQRVEAAEKDNYTMDLSRFRTGNSGVDIVDQWAAKKNLDPNQKNTDLNLGARSPTDSQYEQVPRYMGISKFPVDRGRGIGSDEYSPRPVDVSDDSSEVSQSVPPVDFEDSVAGTLSRGAAAGDRELYDMMRRGYGPDNQPADEAGGSLLDGIMDFFSDDGEDLNRDEFLDKYGPHRRGSEANHETGTPTPVPTIDPVTIDPATTDPRKVATTTPSATSGRSGAESGAAGMLSELDKTRERDKWLALARMGFTMMSTNSEHFADALGAGGLAGLDSLEESNLRYQDAVDAMRANEAKMRLAEMKASGSGSGSSSGGLPAGITPKLAGEFLDEASKRYHAALKEGGWSDDDMKALREEWIFWKKVLGVGIPMSDAPPEE
jgi:hypothetical protein